MWGILLINSREGEQCDHAQMRETLADGGVLVDGGGSLDGGGSSDGDCSGQTRCSRLITGLSEHRLFLNDT